MLTVTQLIAQLQTMHGDMPVAILNAMGMAQPIVSVRQYTEDEYDFECVLFKGE